MKHIKTTVSGIFTLAKQLGYFDGVNPAQGTAISPDATEPPDTAVYSLEDVQSFLAHLPEPADVVFSVAAFAGFRVGEIEVVCSRSKGKDHLPADHDFQRDTRLPVWRGWHPARRGLGSNLYSLEMSDKLIQAILRHSNVSVTLGYYVKTVNADVRDAMATYEENYASKMSIQNLQDTDRTLKLDSGAQTRICKLN